MSAEIRESDQRPTRLPNGLTPAQDAAFEALARAIAAHYGLPAHSPSGGAA